MVAAAVGTTLTIGDTVADGHMISIHLGGPIGHLAWLDDNTIIAQVGPRRLVAVDASSGATAQEPDLPFDVGAFAILQTNT